MKKYQAEMKSCVKAYFKRRFGVRIIRTPPHGLDVCFDLKRTHVPIDVIFDVGANIGQSVLKFKNSFPNSSIYCFEPVKSNFETLMQNTRKLKGINHYLLALGNKTGVCEIYITSDSSMNSIIRPKTFLETEMANISTIDVFSQDKCVENIDILKIDAEGYDLQILQGSERMLRRGLINFIIVEITFNKHDYLNLYDEVHMYLSELGYVVFGIYDQIFIWSERRRLEYANACFCHESLLAKSSLNNM